MEILINEPYEDGPGGKGQYTHKIYHIGSHLPGRPIFAFLRHFISFFCMGRALVVIEHRRLPLNPYLMGVHNGLAEFTPSQH